MKQLIVLIALVAMIGIVPAQDFVRGTYLVKDLSGTDFNVFKSSYFTNDWSMLGDNFAFWTASQSAFLKNDQEDGRGLGNMSPHAAFIGTKMLDRDPRNM